MRRLIAYYLCLFLGTSVLVSGCASNRGNGISEDPELTTYGRADLENRRTMEIPANTNTDNFRKLLMGVSFQEINVKAGEISSDINQALSARLQTEMAKLKRFTIFSAHNRGGVTLFQRLSDVGQANMENAENVNMGKLDLILTCAITVSKERQMRSDHDELIYEIEIDANCEDLKTRTVKFAERAKGRSIRTQALSLSGKQLGGFDDEKDKQALINAAMKALCVLGNKLGNTFPVGGKVVGFLPSGTRFAMDRGFEQGIGKGQQMVLYADCMGVSLPLALAEATPKKTSSSCRIYKWNSRDPDAGPIIKEIKSNPKAWQNYNLFAVGYGMPIPPEWENAYK